MEVEIIDDTHQRFNGVNYRRNKRGWYQTPFTALQRDVWEFHNGAIPKGYEIHHIDGDKSNNQIENLQCVTRKAHRRLHVELDRAKGLIASPPKKYFICPKCGKEFSSVRDDQKLCPACRAKPKPEHVIKPFRPRRFRTCIVCGKPFRGHHSWQKTCSPECGRKLSGKKLP